MKFSKKLLERQFSLGMILYYCIKHTNHRTVPPIIAMLNWFLRNLGDSTQEERESIDHVEYKLLYHIVPHDSITKYPDPNVTWGIMLNYPFYSTLFVRK